MKAQDKDLGIKEKLVPFGILEVQSGEFTIVFGTSRETSDFIVECLKLWWEDRKASHGHIRELVINLDNGPELASNRTQFIKRITEFADRCGLEIHLVYYPPYHSKYNPVERVWGILALSIGPWALERGAAGRPRDRHRLGQIDDLERDFPNRAGSRKGIRDGCQGRQESIPRIPGPARPQSAAPKMGCRDQTGNVRMGDLRDNSISGLPKWRCGSPRANRAPPDWTQLNDRPRNPIRPCHTQRRRKSP